jgi:hypothetical protein
MPETPPEPSVFVTEVTHYRWHDEYGSLRRTTTGLFLNGMLCVMRVR